MDPFCVPTLTLSHPFFLLSLFPSSPPRLGVQTLVSALCSVTAVIRFNLVIYIRRLTCVTPSAAAAAGLCVRLCVCVCVCIYVCVCVCVYVCACALVFLNAALFCDGVEKERGESS